MKEKTRGKGTTGKILIIIVLLAAVTGCCVFLLNMQNERDRQVKAAEAEAAIAESANAKVSDAAVAERDIAVAEMTGEVIEVGTPKAVLVDYETEDAERVIGYLEKAGFEAVRSEDVNDLDPAEFDALVIPGGHNITPSVYGAEPDEHTYGTDLEKDKMQIRAIELFVDAGKPVLGICRGEQVLNVAFGGTINQHIPGWHKRYRDVTIQEGSWLYDMMGATASVYHFHHQCIDKLGDGLTATQWDAGDGHIEAIEHESLPVYGLQWHPDSMEETGVEVFAEFRETVQENMRYQR